MNDDICYFSDNKLIVDEIIEGIKKMFIISYIMLLIILFVIGKI